MKRKPSITVAKTAGFCFGVDRAIKLTYDALAEGKSVATLGPIIHNPSVVKELESKIEATQKEKEAAITAQEYEKAAKYRDSYFDVLKTIEKQKVVYENTKINQDIISISYDDFLCSISLIQIRDGRLTNKKDFEVSKADYDSEEEIISYFIKEYYQLSGEEDIPSEIITANKTSFVSLIIYLIPTTCTSGFTFYFITCITN